MRIRDRGSVVGFIVVAVVIVALFIGAVVLVKHFNAKPAAPANQPSDGKVSNGNNNGDNDKSNDDQALKKALNDQSNKSGSNSGNSGTPSTGSNLPQTGPTDDIMTVVAAGLLVGSGIAYIGSRRLL